MLLVAEWAHEQDLEPGIDPYGNLWALPPDWTGRILTAGSHVDTVPDGGRYDGALGTVLGLELAAELGPERGAGILICAAEEAPRFGAGCVGSRRLAGTLDPEELQRLHDAAGVAAADALQDYLSRLSTLPRIAPPTERWRAHVEVHVAQRRALQQLGVVTRVAGVRRYEITVRGAAAHAGEVSMNDRRDALAGSADIVLAIEAAARIEPAETVATVGTCSVLPGAVSVIPGEVRLGVDLRGVAADSLDRLEATISASVSKIAAHRSLHAQLVTTRQGDPVTLDRQLATLVLSAADAEGIAVEETWSGAGHDAQHLNSIVPALLIFVPLHDGESHTPHEEASIDEIIQAAGLLVTVIRDLA